MKKGPLVGIRVVDCCQMVQGAMAGAVLSDLGADVIKVEQPGTGDPMRGWLQAGFASQTHKVDRNYVFEACNRGKRSIVLDLRKEEGREIIYKLVKAADVFVHNWRGDDVPLRLGVDYETLSKLNPRLVYSHASGFGPEGPDSDLPAFEPGAQARSGWVHLFREPGGAPIIFPGGVGDITGGIMTVLGILACLQARVSTGRGQKVNTSLLGSLLQLSALQIYSSGVAKEVYPLRSRTTMGNPLLNHYKCADGKWLTFTMPWPDLYWHNFCQVLGIPELEKDPRFENLTVRAQNAVEFIRILDQRMATKPRDQWLKQFRESDLELIYAPVQTIPEVLDDPQVLANEYVVDFDHPVFGPVKIFGLPHRFSETPGDPRSAAPEFGQHTEEVLLELGYTWDEIGRLKEKKVV